MKSIYITGYKPYELNIFKETQPEVRYIKLYLQERIKQLAEEGLEWVIIQGQLGVELWAAEVTLRLKKQYDLKLAIITPFLEHESKWNETNQMYYHKIKSKADYVTSVFNQPYQGGYMFRQATDFILDNTEGMMILYDEVHEASPKYTMAQVFAFKADNDYNMIVISLDDLSVFVNEYSAEQLSDED